MQPTLRRSGGSITRGGTDGIWYVGLYSLASFQLHSCTPFSKILLMIRTKQLRTILMFCAAIAFALEFGFAFGAASSPERTRVAVAGSSSDEEEGERRALRGRAAGSS